MRKPFSLEEYNTNPEQTIVTRDGRSVEILYTDRLSERCVIALVDGTDTLYYYANGRGNGAQGEDNEDDLFFVTPDEGRTPEQEFEIVLGNFAEEFELAATDCNSKEYKNCDGNLQLIIKKYVPKLLEVAKKTYLGEIHDEVQKSINNTWEEGREFGKKEILEDAKDVVVLEDECTEWFKGGVSMGLSFMDIDFGDKEEEVCDNLGLCDGDKILVKVTKL